MKQGGPDWYFIVLILLASSIPLSEFGMSVAQILLMLVWIFYDRPAGMGFFRAVGGIVASRFRKFLQNRAALIAASVYALHLLGLFYTSDLETALKDLRIKLPLLVLPLVMGSMPRLSQAKTNALMMFYLAGVFAGSLFTYNAYLKGQFTDVRELSLFISPVRFSLNLVFATVMIAILLLRLRPKQPLFYVLGVGLALWFFFTINLLESATGFLGLVVLLSLLIFRLIWYIKKKSLRFALLGVAIITPVSAVFYVVHTAKVVSTRQHVAIENLDQFTARGYPYRHDTVHFGVEDGKYIGLYFAEAELADAWNRRSKYDFYGKDEAGQLIMYTIIRYMTSKDLRKDAEGVAALTDQDVRNIERGIANAAYLNPGLRNRISKAFLGYQNLKFFGDPNNSSDFQRLEYFRAAFHIIKSNLWFGVGTGDVSNAFREAYQDLQTPLQSRFQWRTHNQFITIAVTFGLIGLGWFLFALIYPPVVSKRFGDLLFYLFFVLMFLSMLSEDTLDSQPGVTLFAFFYNFLLFAAAETKTQRPR